jgi:hypothetical protein
LTATPFEIVFVTSVSAMTTPVATISVMTTVDQRRPSVFPRHDHVCEAAVS